MMSAPARNILRVDLAHEIGITQVQLVVAAIDIDALGVEHRAHRAVEDVNAVGFEKFSKRFALVFIADCRFPIADCRSGFRSRFVQSIGNRKLAIGNKKSRAKQRGTS